MTTKTNILVRATRRLDATPDLVFDAWLHPDPARKFFFATPTGQIVRAEIDPRVGGAFVIVDRREGVDVVHTGTYLELERPRRIAFTFSVDRSESTRVNIDIAPLGGGSGITLIHELPAELVEHATRAEEGWGKMLEALDAALR